MFVLPGVIALLSGLYIAMVYGAAAFTDYAHRIDTKSEAVTFFRHLIIALAGLSIIVTAFHSLVR